MLLILLCVVIGACIFMYRTKSKIIKHVLPPAYPGALPFIGHTHILLTDSSKLWLRVQDIANNANKQGGVVHVVLGKQIYYVIVNAQDALTASNACTHKHFACDFVKRWLGDGLLSASGELWQRHRKLLQPTFSLPIIYGYLNVFNSQARKLVSHMESEACKNNFNPADYLQNIALETFCQSTFGIKDVENKKVTQIYKTSVATILEIATHRFQTFWLHSEFLYKLSGLRKKEQDVVDNLKIMSHEIMQRKKAAIKNAALNNETDNFQTTGIKYKPALDHLLELSADKTLSDKQIIEEVDTMVAAAFETTSTQLMYTLMFLGAHPNVQDKMLKEILEVVGPDKDVEGEDINRLEYTNAIIMESLRMLPAVPVLLRYVEKDVKLTNYTMRAGSQCALMPLVYPNDLTWGPAGDKFIPERWLENAELCGKKEFAGFGLGKRACIGRQYAMVSMKVFLVHFIRHYRVTADMSELKVKLEFVLKPIAGNVISTVRRNESL